jgi:D-amino-acid dehydrogenase
LIDDPYSAQLGDDVIVVGGGLIGLCAAYFLRRKGLRVLVIEREQIGSGAARGNGGQIVVSDAVPLAAPGMVSHGVRLLFDPASSFYVKPTQIVAMAPFLLRFARQATRSRFDAAVARLDVLNRRTIGLVEAMQADGVGTDLHDTPYVYAFADRASATAGHRFARDLARSRGWPVPGELLDGAGLVAYDPALSDAVVAGFLQTGDRWGDPSRFVDQLRDRLRRDGVEFVEGTEVTNMTETASGVAVRASGEVYEGATALIAAGAWSRQLLAGLGVHVILVPGKGYSLAVEVEQAPKGVVMFSDAHVATLPLGPTTLRLAGTMEFDGRFEGIDPRRVRAIIEGVKPLLRQADWGSVRDEWVAPRPMTPDGVPYIGVVPGRRRIYVAAGHNMLGFSLAPATGQVMTEMMTGESDAATRQAFAVDRRR